MVLLGFPYLSPSAAGQITWQCKQALIVDFSVQDEVVPEGRAAFAALPRSVAFTDVEAGNHFSQDIILTNVSGAPAYFMVICHALLTLCLADDD